MYKGKCLSTNQALYTNTHLTFYIEDTSVLFPLHTVTTFFLYGNIHRLITNKNCLKKSIF